MEEKADGTIYINMKTCADSIKKIQIFRKDLNSSSLNDVEVKLYHTCFGIAKVNI